MQQERPARFAQDRAAFEALLAELKPAPAIALDTESNSFHAYFEKVCLLQISTPAADWIVDPLAVDVRPLGPLLAEPTREVVIHAADYDVRCLRRDYAFSIANLFDTMLAAKLLGRTEIGLAALVKRDLGIHMTKEHQRSDWGHRPLSSAQLEYAWRDTRHLLELRALMAAELAAAGLMPKAREWFARQAASQPRPHEFDCEGYRRIRGFRALDELGRQVARALWMLREERARAVDRPPFKVFGNEAILELARLRPPDLDALARVRGVGPSTARRDGKAILDAIAKPVADAAGVGRTKLEA